jgi:hypothetical protein
MRPASNIAIIKLRLSSNRLFPVIHYVIPIYGTGSWPWPPHGWQRNSRLLASQPPFIAPYFCKASIA